MDTTRRNARMRRLGRRALLRRTTMGLGSLALTQLLTRDLRAGAKAAGAGATHHRPRAKNVIFLHLVGGPSQMDLFDPKPALNRHAGKPLPRNLLEGQSFAFISPDAHALGSPYGFRRHGDAGTQVSELLPHTAGVADHLTVVRSMKTEEFGHGAAQLFLHTGNGRLGRPSFGSWVSYGLGSLNDNLPSFVVLGSGGMAGSSLWSNAFLPGHHQGVLFRDAKEPVLYLGDPAGMDRDDRRDVIGAVRRLNELAHRASGDDEIATRTAQYEMAFRMQTSVPDLTKIDREPEHVLRMYGADPEKGSFAKNCLLARRLVEQGVRFVQVMDDDWDHHDAIYKKLPESCRKSDQAAAALIRDLAQRGLLDETLVIWGGEFGRTPMAQGLDPKTLGRDHHRDAFTIWLAGGGVKPGLTYGETDDFGLRTVRDPVHVHDLHATALHLLGIDHTRLTYKHQGRDFRLTDVHGTVVQALLA